MTKLLKIENHKRSVDLIERAVKDMKQKGVSPWEGEGGYRSIHGCWIPIKLLEIESVEKVIQGFLKDKCLKETLSKETIVLKVLFTLRQLWEEPEPKPLIKEFLEELEKHINSSKTYRTYVPIRGIYIEQAKYDITERVRIVRVTSENYTEFFPPKGLTEKYFMPYSIELVIDTPDYRRAMEISLEASKIITHFFRFIDYFGFNQEDLELRIPGFGFDIEQLRVVTVSRGTDGKISDAVESKLEEKKEHPLEFDYIEEDGPYCGLQKFKELLNRLLTFNLGEWDNHLLRAITLFGESKIEHDDLIRFLKLMLVIECLLNTGSNDPVVSTLSDSMAFILKTTAEERIAFASSIKDLYGKRSKIVHTGSSDIDYTDLLELESHVAELLRILLIDEKYINIQSKSELKSLLDKMKYSGV